MIGLWNLNKQEYHNEWACAGWPDYPYASLFALVTIVVVLFLEHLVSMAYEKRVLRQLGRPQSPGALQPPLLPSCFVSLLASKDWRGHCTHARKIESVLIS